MHNAQDYYHFHGFGSAQEGGGVWLQNHKKCTGWQATKLNLKTCFIVIFLCPIGSRPAIPKPNHMILSPHNACIKGQTGPGRGPLWGAKVKREYFVFRKQQTNQKKTNRPTVHAGTVSSTRLSRAGYYLSLPHAGDLPIGACAPP